LGHPDLCPRDFQLDVCGIHSVDEVPEEIDYIRAFT